jgi:surface-anchored protein
LVLSLAVAGCGDNAEAPQEIPDLEACGTGYARTGDACIDVDECTAQTDNCSGRATCANTPGSFTCGCPAGWQLEGTGCALLPCKYQYEQGHGDLYLSWTRATGMSAAIRSELEPGRGEMLYPALDVCINIPRATYDEVVEFGGRPPGPEWDAIGIDESQPFWYLPEVAIEGRPWFGLASDQGQLGGVPIDEFTGNLMLTIAVEKPPASEFSMWVSSGTGDLPDFRFSTVTGALTTSLITGSHAHMNWAFTKPGEYLVEVSSAGTLSATGQIVTAAPQLLRFVVHP